MRRAISSIFSEKKPEKISKQSSKSMLTTSKPLFPTHLSPLTPSAEDLIERKRPFIIEGESKDIPLEEGHIYVVRNAIWQDAYKVWLITNIQDITNGYFINPQLFITEDGVILTTTRLCPPSIFLVGDPALKFKKGQQLELFRR